MLTHENYLLIGELRTLRNKAKHFIEPQKRADRRVHKARLKKLWRKRRTFTWSGGIESISDNEVGVLTSTHGTKYSYTDYGYDAIYNRKQVSPKHPPMPVIETLAEIQLQDEVENAGYAPRNYQLEAAWYRVKQKAIHEEELYGSWQQDWDDEDLYFDQCERDSAAYEERRSALDDALEAEWDPWEGTHEIEHIFFDHGRMQSQQITAAMFYAA